MKYVRCSLCGRRVLVTGMGLYRHSNRWGKVCDSIYNYEDWKPWWKRFWEKITRC